jgi:hypothetical protein
MRKIYYNYFLTFLLFAAILSPHLLYGQPTLEWMARYNLYYDNRNDAPSDMVIDTAGNIYITGSALTTSRSNNFITIKYNSSGVQQWAVLYDGPGSNGIDVGVAIALDKFGNVYVTGHSERGGLYTDDYCTIKYNNNGVQQWIARYNGTGSGQHVPTGIAVDNNGNVYVTGYSTGNGTDYDYLTIKYNTNGDSLWTRRYIGALNDKDFSFAIAIDDQASVYITGTTYEGSPNSYDCTTIKYNTNGDMQWVTKSNENDVAGGRKIVVDKNRNSYVCGGINTIENYLTIKYSPSGQILWKKINSLGKYAYDIKVDSNSNVVVTGWIIYSAVNTDYLTIKYNSNGDTLWSRIYNGTANSYDEATSLCIDKFNDIYVAGRSTGASGYDFTTVKYLSYGIQQWVARYPGGADKILVDKNLNLYLTGTNSEGGTSLDIITLKYSQPVGIKPLSNEVVSSYRLYQNYPNPFNNQTVLEFDAPNTDEIQLLLYNITGALVNTIFTGSLNPGRYKITLNAENLSTGIYFCCLKDGERMLDVKKLTLIK